jgi:hypothetical protein
MTNKSNTMQAVKLEVKPWTQDQFNLQILKVNPRAEIKARKSALRFWSTVPGVARFHMRVLAAAMGL